MSRKTKAGDTIARVGTEKSYFSETHMLGKYQMPREYVDSIRGINASIRAMRRIPSVIRTDPTSTIFTVFGEQVRTVFLESAVEAMVVGINSINTDHFALDLRLLLSSASLQQLSSEASFNCVAEVDRDNARYLIVTFSDGVIVRLRMKISEPKKASRSGRMGFLQLVVA